ncbi:MAG: hypothetical protein AB2669_08275 [Candidatus Thiodiazotropha endolucinida]
MAGHKSKARARLRQLQSQRKQQQQFHQALNTKLTALDDNLYQLLQGQQFFQLALLALSSWECNSESWLTGALTVEKQLHQCADEFIQQWSDLRQWVNTQYGEVHHG